MTLELRMVKRVLNKQGKLVPELDADGNVKYHPTFKSEKGFDIWKEFESKLVKKPRRKRNASGTNPDRQRNNQKS